MLFNKPMFVTNNPEPPEIEKPYITFSSSSSFTVSMYSKGTDKKWDGTLEYSTDTDEWNTWDGYAITSVLSDNKYIVYLRGTNNTTITGDSVDYGFVISGSSVSCYGNIENILDYETTSDGNHPTMARCCFANLFNNCSALVSAPELNAETLSVGCYLSMFQRCTNLKTVPDLNSTSLEQSCYQSMFSRCTSITKAKELPATTAKGSCYFYMFAYCTSLTTIPKIKAIGNLPTECFYYMFYRCTSVKLSQTQTDEYIYEYRIPSSGTISSYYQYSFYEMFNNTGGTFTGTPSANTTYYTDHEPA